jgi:hypothetical protein
MPSTEISSQYAGEIFPASSLYSTLAYQPWMLMKAVVVYTFSGANGSQV